MSKLKSNTKSFSLQKFWLFIQNDFLLNLNDIIFFYKLFKYCYPKIVIYIFTINIVKYLR